VDLVDAQVFSWFFDRGNEAQFYNFWTMATVARLWRERG